jgi:O-acetyl-ADP-ribose deacetylase (regulator of RNase III)
VTISYAVGDATRPQGVGPKVIAHICNDEGGWGRGFVVALSRRDKAPEKAYRAWKASNFDGYKHLIPDGWYVPVFGLGATQIVPYSLPGVWVANMIAQRGIRREPQSPRAVDYRALATALDEVGDFAENKGASVHMPRIGCGLGGGSWSEVEPIINKTLTDRGIAVTVYDPREI